MFEPPDTFARLDPKSVKHIPKDLLPSESQMFCPNCGFTLEPNTAARPECPDCGERMRVASEPMKKS